MISPCRRTPRYHLGPMRLIFTSAKPAFVNHCRHRRLSLAATCPLRLYVTLHHLSCIKERPSAESQRDTADTSRPISKLGGAQGHSPSSASPDAGHCGNLFRAGPPQMHISCIFCCAAPTLDHHWLTGKGRTSVYSSSVGKSIQASANRRDSQKVGCTGPIKQARPPSLITLHAQHGLALVYPPGEIEAVLLIA